MLNLRYTRWRDKLVWIPLVAIAATIVLPIKVHNVSIVLTLTLLAYFFYQSKGYIKYNVQFVVLLLLALHLSTIIVGILRSGLTEKGSDEIERAAYPIIMLPCVYLIYQQGITRNHLFSVFAWSCISLTLFGFLHAANSMNVDGFVYVLQQGHKNFTGFIGIQPLYLSVYFIFICFFLIEWSKINFRTTNNQTRVIVVTAIVFSVLMIGYLRSKTALLVFPTLLIIYLVIILKKRGWLVAFVLLLFAVLSMLLDNNGGTGLLDEYGKTVSKAFDQRIMIWKGALVGIRESPVFGAGTGADQELLNRGYSSIGYTEGVINNFNAHNQYLQFLARNGMVELACFLALMFYSFWRSSQESTYTFLMFNMLVSLVMITESFLCVQKGFSFFYLFLLTFLYIPETGNSKSLLK